jgi:acetyl esterase/lipase
MRPPTQLLTPAMSSLLDRISRARRVPFHAMRVDEARLAYSQAAEILTGVAPACVILAECDPLVDEGLAYADRLRAAGVPVQMDLVRGVTHDFIKMGRALKQAGEAQQFAADALAQSWSRA